MARKFSDLTKDMPKERLARIEKLKQDMHREDVAYQRLQEIRQSLALTQVELAKLMKVNQAAVSKLEAQDDMYVSTLRRIISALGGELHIRASFPDGLEFEITQFTSLEESAGGRRKQAR
jgi:transcriptional regulator with XRE-family HTH domain